MTPLLIEWYLVSVLFHICFATVPTYKLNDGNNIPGIALGTWLGFSSETSEEAYRKGLVKFNDNKTEQAVLWALEAGYRHIDTAFIYGLEDQIGRALTKKFKEGLKREEVFITTKLWNDAHARDAVVPALRKSLSDLNLDYVDLYLIHFPIAQFPNGSNDYTDYVETWRGMMEAKSLGLTKSIGVSSFTKHQIERLLDHGLEKPAALQMEVNLNLQQSELLSYCKQQNIVVMGFTPFGSLFYQKAASDAPPPRIDDPALVKIALKYNKTVPQVVLRYLVELGVIPLPKSLNKSRIEQNLDIFDFELTSTERDLLKSYDRNYRTLPMSVWQDHPYYPFEKTINKE